jgi:competence protein ComEA
MTLSDWKRKNNLMVFSENQTRGLIAFCVILAVIPFIVFLLLPVMKYEIPDFTSQCDGCIIMELVDENQNSGIYFIKPENTLTPYLKEAGMKQFVRDDIPIRTGIKLISAPREEDEIVVGKMDAAKRLALGLPLNINDVSGNDLIMVKGIGEKTAKKILELRDRNGRFKKIEELMEIKGIKEKRLAEMREYLYIER